MKKFLRWLLGSPLPKTVSELKGLASWPEAAYPHCDMDVLHAPGECEYCDRYPERQTKRREARVAFTGHKPRRGERECPSDKRRGKGGAHVWPGNRPSPRT